MDRDHRIQWGQQDCVWKGRATCHDVGAILVLVAASALFAVPVLAMLLSWLVLGEVTSVVMPAWAALAICGTLLVIALGGRSG